MPRTRNPYPAEFRDQIIALARAGRSVESLAREFEPCVATIHGWVKHAEIDGGARDDGLTSAERDELRRLRKENRIKECQFDLYADRTSAYTMRANNCGSGSLHSPVFCSVRSDA